MAENTTSPSQQNNEDVRRDDLRQKHAEGRDSTRTGSTGGDVQASEWKPGDAERHRSEDAHTGSSTGSGTNAGNGGDFTGK